MQKPIKQAAAARQLERAERHNVLAAAERALAGAERPFVPSPSSGSAASSVPAQTPAP